MARLTDPGGTGAGVGTGTEVRAATVTAPAEAPTPRSRARHQRGAHAKAPAGRPSGSDALERSIGYMPALDGVRGFAIALVLFFHGGFAWASGGFIGVDVFFVLSGFLITSLLLAEFKKTGGIRLPRFWANRARRLLPALLAMLAGVALYAVFLAPADTLGQVRSNALATLFYGANWNQIAQGQGYFEALASPTPLVHTWSLAIEEQFYLVWPVVVLLLMRWRRSLGPLLVTCLAGAVASAVAMDLLYAGGNGATRVYYGTDTRAQDLLIGALLAIAFAYLVWRRRQTDADGSPSTMIASLRAGPLLSGLMVAAAGVGLAVILWMTVAVDQNSTWPYAGGFALVSVCTAALLAAVVVVPRCPWGVALSWRPVRYLGRISYGLYLWHWPVFLVLNGERTGLVGWPLFFVRLAVAVAIAVVSFHFLEMPIRRGALRSWRAWIGGPAAVGATAVVLVASTAGAAAPVSAAPTTYHHVPVNPGHHAVDPGTSAAVAAVPAGTGGPVRLLMLGDSEASFLGFGLGPESAGHGISFTDDGVIGCGLQQGATTLQDKVEIDLYGIRGADTWVPCANQDVRWRADLDTFNPDVVMLSDGQYEVRDRLVDGHWTHLGQPLFDRHELAAIEQSVNVLSSTGATVVLLTAPYYNSGGEQLNGDPWPENSPQRVRVYNSLLRQVAARHPGTVVVADLNAHLDPSGHYQQNIGHVQVRYSDGIHATTAGGKLISPWLLGQAYQLGVQSRSRNKLPAPPPPPPPGPPPASSGQGR